LALALLGTGLRVAVFDKTSFATSFRPIALSYASRLILERVGAWPTATPIETIHVSQAGGFGQARLDAVDAGVPALGYVTDYPALAGGLRSQVEEFITKEALAAAADAEFLAELGAAASSRPGRPVKVEARVVQPLVLRVRAARIAPRAVFIGNAAQTLHPVAGQGLNLGLRDAWDLAQIWRSSSDPGDAATLGRYAARRYLDAATTIRVTDFLARAFLGSNRFARGARGAALTALDIFPPARRFFARRMIYGPSALP